MYFLWILWTVSLSIYNYIGVKYNSSHNYTLPDIFGKQWKIYSLNRKNLRVDGKWK